MAAGNVSAGTLTADVRQILEQHRPAAPPPVVRLLSEPSFDEPAWMTAERLESIADLTAGVQNRTRAPLARDEVTPTGRPFGLRSVGDIAGQVDAAPRTPWLWRRVWPADAYGVLAAGHKVGKTWLMLDAAIAAASGTDWLGLFSTDRTGPVLMFLGEGGLRKMTRRGRAVATHHGVVWDDLPIDMSERVPTLTSELHIGWLRAEV
jgi:hypothetical protein